MTVAASNGAGQELSGTAATVGRMDITADTSVRPFRVDISPAMIEDLRNRLRATRYQPPLPGDGWDTGIPSAYLRELVEAWHDFDWAAYQARLNEVPQYTTVMTDR